MKKFALNTVVIGVLSFIAGWLSLAVWSLAVIAFLVAFIVNDSSGKSYLAGFAIVGLMWFLVASILNIANEGQLSGMVAGLLKIPNSTQLLYVTSMVGALVAGFGAMTGSLARDAFLPKRDRKGERA